MLRGPGKWPMVLQSTLPARGREAPHHDLADCYRARVLELFPGRVERIVLFGSRARGEAHQGSDWDFAVYLGHEPDRDEERRLRDIGRALSGETRRSNPSCLRLGDGKRATNSPATSATRR